VVVERQQGAASFIDVLDRVLDKGIVIDAWVRVSGVGIDLITVEGRVVVASIDTYLRYSETVEALAPAARSIQTPSNTVHKPPNDDDDGRGGNTPPTGGAPSFAGSAEITPRKPPSRHRRPTD